MELISWYKAFLDSFLLLSSFLHCTTATQMSNIKWFEKCALTSTSSVSFSIASRAFRFSSSARSSAAFRFRSSTSRFLLSSNSCSFFSFSFRFFFLSSLFFFFSASACSRLRLSSAINSSSFLFLSWEDVLVRMMKLSMTWVKAVRWFPIASSLLPSL